LELGGKDPAIVLQGADLERAARAIAWAGCVNAGQSCLSIERVYVERAVFDRFTEQLRAEVARLRFGWPRPEDGEIGPLIAARQAEVIRRQLDDAFGRGARALVGGHIRCLDGGLYCEPTVLVDVDHDMLVMQEETFGPILPVMAVDDPDDAVRKANDCVYGLSGAVFGPRELAMSVADRLECGAVSIGDAGLTAMVHDAEKQSFGASGLGGTRMGPRAIERFLRLKTLLVHDRPEPDAWWFAADTNVQK
jgi:succinate-semialdehyde dehydrogenase / glutarate-semialdehyde dehydrogenase